MKPPTQAPGAYVPPSIRKGEPADSQTRQRGKITYHHAILLYIKRDDIYRCVYPDHFTDTTQGQKDFAVILAKNRDTAKFNRLNIKLYIKFVENNGKNRDSVHAAISFCP